MSNSSNFIIQPTSISQAAITADINAWLASQSDFAAWSNFYQSSSGQALINLASGLAAFMKYDSMAARREAYLQLAQNRSSIIAGGQFLGYSSFRGRNAVVSVTFTPVSSGSFAKWDELGLVKGFPMLILTPVAYNSGVPITVEVIIGTLMTTSQIAPTATLNVFYFKTPKVSDDIRMYIDDVEVGTSTIISDILNGDFGVQSNPWGSVDAKYLNLSTFATQYIAGSEIRLDFVELNNLVFQFSDIAVDPALGTYGSASVVSLYQVPESTTSIQINAPLENETKDAVRGRDDMKKIYKKLNPNYVDTAGIDISAAVIKVIGLQDPNYLRLTQADKAAAQAAFTPYRMNGLMPPQIGDASEMALTLAVKLYLDTDFAGDANAAVAAAIAPYANILGVLLDLYAIEKYLGLQDFIEIARPSLTGPTYALSTSYQRGSFVLPPSPNGFIYRNTSINYFSGSSEPTWPTTSGATINDGGLQWTAVSNASPTGITTWAANTKYGLGSSVKPSVSNGFIFQCSYLYNKTGSAEPTWPAITGSATIESVSGTKINDNQITWVATAQVGTPSAWAANTDYKSGDVVIATNQSGSHTTGLMFQAMEFLGKSGSSIPTFPTVIGNSVDDGNVTWTCVDPTGRYIQLDTDQYLTLSTTVTTA